MQEVIASILEAEKKAEEIVKNANEKAKILRQTADEDGEKIKNSAVAVFKVHRLSALKSADDVAEKEYSALLQDGKNKADKLYERVYGKIDDYANEIVQGIIG